MNYFGLFFSFMIPGILVGMMLSSGIRSAICKYAAKYDRRA